MHGRKMELSSTLNVSVKQGFSSYLKLLREKKWQNMVDQFESQLL